MPTELELTESQMRTMVAASLERILTHLSELKSTPPVKYGGEALAKSLRDFTIPEEGKGIDASLSIIC